MSDCTLCLGGLQAAGHPCPGFVLCVLTRPYVHLSTEVVLAEGLLFYPFIHVTHIGYPLCASTMLVLWIQWESRQMWLLASGPLAGDSS